jgi:DNA invertase Pin-like site-specific DNA recombinase
MTCKLVAYYRVSTVKQGQSGLGMEAQRQAVEAQRKATGCEIIAEYEEVESGRKASRPEIAKAIAHCRREGATLVIAKMDRLSRSVSFLSNLMDGGVEFVACDSPQASRLTIHILAAVAEEEARLISTRTRSALKVAKERGIKIGTPANLTTDAQTKGSAANKSKAVADYGMIAPTVKMLRESGMSFGKIADRLNDQNIATRKGSKWSAMQVKRVVDRD